MASKNLCGKVLRVVLDQRRHFPAFSVNLSLQVRVSNEISQKNLGALLYERRPPTPWLAVALIKKIPLPLDYIGRGLA